MFIHPMWDNEAERIGKQKCTPVGYARHGVAELIGFVGLLLLFACCVFLAWKWFTGSFQASALWLLALPLLMGIIGNVLFHYSWRLAYKKGFHYDALRCEATWMESGERRSYTNPPYKLQNPLTKTDD